MNRRACAQRGHRWIEHIEGLRFPFQRCNRWGCHAMRVDPTLGPTMRAYLEGVLDRDQEVRHVDRAG